MVWGSGLGLLGCVGVCVGGVFVGVLGEGVCRGGATLTLSFCKQGDISTPWVHTGYNTQEIITL